MRSFISVCATLLFLSSTGLSGCAVAQVQTDPTLDGGYVLTKQMDIYKLGVDLTRAMDAAIWAGSKYSVTGDKQNGAVFQEKLQSLSQVMDQLEASGDKSEIVGKLIINGKAVQKALLEINLLFKDNRVDVVQFRARSIVESAIGTRVETSQALRQLGENLLPSLDTGEQTDNNKQMCAFFIRANTLVENSKQSASMLSKLSSNSAVDQAGKERDFADMCKNIESGLKELNEIYGKNAEIAPYLAYVDEIVSMRVAESKAVFQTLNGSTELGASQARIGRKTLAPPESDLLEELRSKL